jgi:hypothetical protein
LNNCFLDDNSFDVVYYTQPVPPFETLTFLSLIFDKVIFPGVHIPFEGVDEKETVKEIDRLKKLGIDSQDDVHIINCMVYALHGKYLKEFCLFTGEFGYAGILEDGANKLTMQLEEMVYGPPPPNFHPVPPMGFAKGLPGNDKLSVNSPSWISYPANAFIYASKKGLPLINDNPRMPMLSLGGLDIKCNAKLLSTILAIECVNFVLPKIKPMRPNEIAEFREETKNYVKPFRMSMLKLSKELNVVIKSTISIEEIQKEARFLVETTVYPELEELRKAIQDPGKPWFSKAFDLVKDTPELVTNFATLPLNIAIAKVLVKLGSVFADIGESQSEKEKKARSGITYLLKLNDWNKK